MTITALKFSGAYLLQDTVFKDERGVFTETWDYSQFKAGDVIFKPSNACSSYNLGAMTLRGLHYQEVPFGQAKLVTCVSGSIYDVILDLRPGSSTYLQWQAVELLANTGIGILIPAGCAHGFLTLKNETVVTYLIEGDYYKNSAAGIRWNDPFFNIEWPVKDPIISSKDATMKDFCL